MLALRYFQVFLAYIASVSLFPTVVAGDRLELVLRNQFSKRSCNAKP